VRSGALFLAMSAAAALAACGAPAARPVKGEIARAVEASLAGGREAFGHAEWDRLLAGGTRAGLVDYSRLRSHRGDLDAYLGRVAAAAVDRLAPGHLKALLINAYNAGTVKAILDHPGVETIRKIPGVWTVTTHVVGGFEVTLDDIEHRILRPFFKDPRVHFALNCASRSCAPLPPWAYDGDRIEAQLEERTRAFLADPRHLRLEGGRLLVSRYFDWYGEDFTGAGWLGAAGSIRDYVARHAPPDVARFLESRPDAPLGFLDYDWALNEAPPGPGTPPSPRSGPAADREGPAPPPS
jgi:hypothetical protein